MKKNPIKELLEKSKALLALLDSQKRKPTLDELDKRHQLHTAIADAEEN